MKTKTLDAVIGRNRDERYLGVPPENAANDNSVAIAIMHPNSVKHLTNEEILKGARETANSYGFSDVCVIIKSAFD